jgi:hypothetical protein
MLALNKGTLWETVKLSATEKEVFQLCTCNIMYAPVSTEGKSSENLTNHGPYELL